MSVANEDWPRGPEALDHSIGRFTGRAALSEKDLAYRAWLDHMQACPDCGDLMCTIGVNLKQAWRRLGRA